jgi:predicted Zn-dependent peptidase
MFLGRLEEPEEDIRQVDKVTPEMVKNLAATMLRRERFSLAAVGDLANVTSLSF